MTRVIFFDLFNHGRNNQHLIFIEALQGERCLWDVSSVIEKNRYEKAKSREKLSEQFNVTGKVKSCSLNFHLLSYSI